LFKIAHKNVSRTLAVEIGGESVNQVVLPERLLTMIAKLGIPEPCSKENLCVVLLRLPPTEHCSFGRWRPMFCFDP